MEEKKEKWQHILEKQLHKKHLQVIVKIKNNTDNFPVNGVGIDKRLACYDHSLAFSGENWLIQIHI